MDDKGMSRRIRDAVIEILKTIEYKGEPAFVSVLDNTKDSFNGYPALRVLPDNLATVTSQTAEKDHTVSFAAIMHFPLESPTDIESKTYNSMLDLTDLIVDVLEKADHRDEISEIDPTVVNWRMDVTQAPWSVATGKAGSLLLCEIGIAVTYSKTVY